MAMVDEDFFCSSRCERTSLRSEARRECQVVFNSVSVSEDNCPEKTSRLVLQAKRVALEALCGVGRALINEILLADLHVARMTENTFHHIFKHDVTG